MKTENINRWVIQDEEGVIHSGTEEEMDIAWDYMTMSINELFEYHDGKIEKWYLEEQKKRWEYPWVGDLELIQIVKTHR
jgi:hypothetical protein